METSSSADGYDHHGPRGRYDEEVSFYSVKRMQSRYAVFAPVTLDVMRLKEPSMLRAICHILLACCFVLPVAAVGAEPPEITKLQKGMPPAVAGLIARIVYCNHWQGEDPYDSERAKEIQSAVAELRCASLGADETVVLKQYGQRPSVRKAITAAKEVYL